MVNATIVSRWDRPAEIPEPLARLASSQAIPPSSLGQYAAQSALRTGPLHQRTLAEQLPDLIDVALDRQAQMKGAEQTGATTKLWNRFRAIFGFTPETVLAASKATARAAFFQELGVRQVHRALAHPALEMGKKTAVPLSHRLWRHAFFAKLSLEYVREAAANRRIETAETIEHALTELETYYDLFHGKDVTLPTWKAQRLGIERRGKDQTAEEDLFWIDLPGLCELHLQRRKGGRSNCHIYQPIRNPR